MAPASTVAQARIRPHNAPRVTRLSEDTPSSQARQARSQSRPLPAFSRMLRLTAPSRADLIAMLLIAGAAALLIRGLQGVVQPLSTLQTTPITLAPANLPGYALRTTLRMFAALAASLVFTLGYATLAAKSKRAEQILIPALDILQSIPPYGYLTFTLAFLMGLFPGHVLGAECASVFTIFTAQAWNMTFSFYQSLRTIPEDLAEVAQGFALSPVRRFLRLELPFATPALVWNMMMSMSGGWFMVVLSEAVTVGNTTVTLPGIGSYLGVAITQQNLRAVLWAVLAMALVILAYDQLVFRPVVAWADRFRFEQTASTDKSASWAYDLFRRTVLFDWLFAAFALPAKVLLLFDHTPRRRAASAPARPARMNDTLWRVVVLLGLASAGWAIFDYVHHSLSVHDFLLVAGLACLTLARVLVLIVLASLIWVPVGVWIGLRPAWAEKLQPIAQFLAAFPAQLLYPFVVIAILRFHLMPDIWLSPLMILGTQWYIMFNVIAGASAIPNDLREVAGMYGVRGLLWWRQVALPAIFPYYVTGALTASGGSWNASVVAEVVSWGSHKLSATGLGSYIANAADAGDMPRVALGCAMMSLFVVTLNRVLWRPLYAYGERRMRLS